MYIIQYIYIDSWLLYVYMLAIHLGIPESPCISTGQFTKELCRTHVPQPTCVRVFQAITAQAGPTMGPTGGG